VSSLVKQLLRYDGREISRDGFSIWDTLSLDLHVRLKFTEYGAVIRGDQSDPIAKVSGISDPQHRQTGPDRK
jgi:hypothetical protein